MFEEGEVIIMLLKALCCFLLLDYDIANLVYYLLTRFNERVIHFYGVVSN